MRHPTTTPTLIDLTAHPHDQPVRLPARGPLALRFCNVDDGRLCCWPRVSRGLAVTILRGAGWVVSEE